MRRSDAGRFVLKLFNDERVSARSVLIASGARYRRLDVEDLEAFESSSVHYWASPLEGSLCAGQEVALVGAGNSAGQAVVYLASQVAKVSLLVRGADLGASMSRYLVDRIEGLANVEVVTGARITSGEAGMPSDTLASRPARRNGDRSAICSCSSAAELNTRRLAGSGVALDQGFDRRGRRGPAAAGDSRRARLRSTCALRLDQRVAAVGEARRWWRRCTGCC
jgi:thioredoxin reductase (NADPH)